MGSNWWTVACWNNVRGIMEFNVSALPVRSFRRVILRLRDTGVSGSGEPQVTHLLGYSGDGRLTVNDWGVSATFIVPVLRADVAGTTEHDVTDFVNAELLSGDAFIGFRLEPGSPSSFDAFGLLGELRLE